MAGNPYDLIPYPNTARRQTHPDRLAAVGKLLGMQPAPVDECRVLEIGCNSGGNLIPMAYNLPRGRFVGVELAAAPVAEAARTIADLGLANIEILQQDLRGIGPAWGEFDYIIAHGVYSWVSEEVGEALLSVCGQRLTEEGIAFISYNALPGGHVRQMLREMMLHHIRGMEEPSERIREARAFLAALTQTPQLTGPWRDLRDLEVNSLLARDGAALYHDEIAPFNRRVYFHEFITAAGRHGLQYAGEADPHEMFDPTGSLASFAGDWMDREQQLDFLKARRFRQTLLARAERPLDRTPSPQQMREFLFSTTAKRLEDGRIEGSRKICITPANEAAVQVALAINDMFPLPAAFEDLVPYAGSEDTACEILFALMMSGFADLHSYSFPCEETVTERPRANGLVRYQAARSDTVTSAVHYPVQLDDAGRRIVQLADGTRTHVEIAAGLGDGQDPEFLRSGLEWMASHALLDG